MAQTKLFVVAGVVLLDAACWSGGATNNTLAIAQISYADDGTLVAASRERIVRLGPMLNEIDRTVPPFPFDPKVQPGLESFGVSRDGNVASIGWQNNTNPPAEPTLTAGGIVFDLGSAWLLRSDAYSPAPTAFQGLFLAPDGQTTAVLTGTAVQVAAVAGGTPLWQTTSFGPPLFTGDGAALVVETNAYAFDVLRVSDGSRLTSLAPAVATSGLAPAAASADGSTVAVFGESDETHYQITTWRVSDGTLLQTIALDQDGTFPAAMVLGPDGSQVAVAAQGGDLLVWSGGQLLYRLHETPAFLYTLAFSPDGSTLATVDKLSGSVRLLRASDGTVVAEKTISATP